MPMGTLQLERLMERVWVHQPPLMLKKPMKRTLEPQLASLTLVQVSEVAGMSRRWWCIA